MFGTYSKKRRREFELPTAKPTAVFLPDGTGRPNTLSIALPSSIIANAPGLSLKTKLAGNIARAAAVFCVDEIVVFEDWQSPNAQHSSRQAPSHHRESRRHDQDGEYVAADDPTELLVHILSYLECPPHLRKQLFPMHPHLRLAGTLPPLDIPHHLRADEWCRYREGVTLGSGSNFGKLHGCGVGLKAEKPKSTLSKKNNDGPSLYKTRVYAGFDTMVQVAIAKNTRVTLRFASKTAPCSFPFPSTQHDGFRSVQLGPIDAEVVDPAIPREEAGYYWGYSVRHAKSLSTVFTESPFEDGYDLSIGTSERGSDITEVLEVLNASPNLELGNKHRVNLQFKHSLIVFGGVAGLEAAVCADLELARSGIEAQNLAKLFDFYVNICPGQGSRTIRTEEAIWIALSQLKPTLFRS